MEITKKQIEKLYQFTRQHFVGIMIYVSLEIIPPKAKELLEETYPEYKLS